MAQTQFDDRRAAQSQSGWSAFRLRDKTLFESSRFHISAYREEHNQ
jgi:hypothetical protein